MYNHDCVFQVALRVSTNIVIMCCCFFLMNMFRFVYVFPLLLLIEMRGTGVMIEKMRSDQERDRKVVKEAPSDPRRRRRTSESSSTPKDAAQATNTTKKSPRLDDPPAKIRRSGSRNAINTITRELKVEHFC